MKKFAIIGGGVVLAAGLGYSGLWYAGQGAVNALLDAEIARMKAEGTELTAASRSMGGFPFGYEITLTDVTLTLANGLAKMTLPNLVGVSGVTDPGALTLRFPAQAAVEITMPAEMVAADPGMPAQIKLDLTSEGFTSTIRPAAGGERVIEAVAKSVSVSQAAPDQSGTVKVGLTDVSSRTIMAADPGQGISTSTSTVGRIDYDVTSATPEGGSMKMVGAYTQAEIATTSNLGGKFDPKVLFGPASVLGLTYKTGPADIVMTMSGDPMGADGTLTIKAASGTGAYALKDGVMTLQGDSVDNVWQIASANPVMPVNGSVTVSKIDSAMTFPLTPREASQPMALRMAIDGLVLDDGVWALIDAGKALSREPARMVIDLAGTMKVTGDLMAQTPDSPPPFEMGALQIKASQIGALGAEVSATGEIEFLQPMMIPVGTVKLNTTRALAAVEQLVAAGWLDGEMAQMAQAMAQVYAQPGSTPDSLVSDITMTPDGAIMINGLPLE